MAPKIPPVRLAADPNAPEELRGLIDQARSEVPNASTLAQFGSRLEAAIAANVPAPTVDLTSMSTSVATGAKTLGIALGVVLGGVIASGIWFGSRGNDSSALTRAPAASALAPTVAASTTSALAPEVGAPAIAAPIGSTPPERSVESAQLVEAQSPQPGVADESPNAVRTETAANAAQVAPPTGASKQSSAGRATNDEAALLLAARAALKQDPAAALRLTKEHARRFANGDLVQEREVIAIEALRRLGQTDAAQKRGAAFEEQFPGSAHRSKVEQTLQGK